MASHVKLKVYSIGELRDTWSARAWKDTPSTVIALPFPKGVLFGAENRETGERASFFLSREDAFTFGMKLITGALEAGAE